MPNLLGLPVQVEQFVPHWLALPVNWRQRLGETPAFGALGCDALLGSRVRDCQYRFRVRVGPMGMIAFRDLLPDGRQLVRVEAVVRNYQGDELAWDLQLVLKGDQVPPLRLGGGERLGWSTWLYSQSRDRDADDLCLNPQYLKIQQQADNARGDTP